MRTVWAEYIYYMQGPTLRHWKCKLKRGSRTLSLRPPESQAAGGGWMCQLEPTGEDSGEQTAVGGEPWTPVWV